SITRTQDLVTVQWFGIQGPFELLHAPALFTNDFQQVGPSTFATNLTVQSPGDDGFFRVIAGRPPGTLNYLGAAACAECHEDTVAEWAEPPHAHALDSLKRVGQLNNSQCLPCHTVGFGTPLGFRSDVTTPHLSGVQCENCHGPAANHVAVTRDAS